MPNLTPLQEKRVKKLREVIEKGEIAIIEHMMELEEKVDDAIASVEERIKNISTNLDPSLKEILKQIKGEPGKTPVKGVDYKDGKDGEDGEDGKDYVITERDLAEIATRVEVPIVEKVIVEKRIETIVKEQPIIKETKIEVENDITGLEIVEKVNDLPNGEKDDEYKIDFSHIKGYKDFIIGYIKKHHSGMGGGAPIFVGSGGAGRVVRSYDLTSQLDGVTKTFNLPALYKIISVHASSTPFSFRESVDYTYTPTSITFTSEINAGSTLATGQTVTIIYSEA